MSCVAQNVPSSRWLDRALAAPLLTLVKWYRVAQDRAALRSLPAERLNDLGLTRQEARREAQRPFWDASLGR